MSSSSCFVVPLERGISKHCIHGWRASGSQAESRGTALNFGFMIVIQNGIAVEVDQALRS